eukprot:TRINITY_DN7280_c0_g1_i1.p2 TRINITY_DN7280_c0_g1~~TRINITY_DN7280_c0_g1_i1.p2  ORF type:complete len:240 (+),score=53.09 TRINITY_DN7280_c0_g1_i1:63-782(+)
MRFLKLLWQVRTPQDVQPAPVDHGQEEQLICLCSDRKVYFLEQPEGGPDEHLLGRPAIEIHDEDPHKAQETIANLIKTELESNGKLSHCVRKYSMDQKRQFVYFFQMLYEETKDQEQPFDVELVDVSQEELFGESKVETTADSGGGNVRLNIVPIDRDFLTPQDPALRDLFWEMSPNMNDAIKEVGKRLKHCVKELRQEGKMPWIDIVLYKIQPLIGDGDNKSLFWCAHAFSDLRVRDD